MPKGKYTPQLKDELITRLYRVARKFHMPMTKVLNLIVVTAQETLPHLICVLPLLLFIHVFPAGATDVLSHHLRVTLFWYDELFLTFNAIQ